MKTVTDLWTRGQTVESIRRISNGVAAAKMGRRMVAYNASIPLPIRSDVFERACKPLVKILNI
jgi:hypothetical protein